MLNLVVHRKYVQQYALFAMEALWKLPSFAFKLQFNGAMPFSFTCAIETLLPQAKIYAKK